MLVAEYLQIAHHYFGPGLWLVLAMLAVELVNLLTLRKLNALGIAPRAPEGLPGILFSPLLHSDVGHFLANFPPVVLLCFVLGQLMPTQFWWIVGAIVLGTGGLVWLFARRQIHVGASGLIYGLFGFLTLHGYFSGNVVHLVIGAALLVLYSGFLWGVLPGKARVSWESHLAGLVVGAALAWWNRF